MAVLGRWHSTHICVIKNIRILLANKKTIHMVPINSQAALSRFLSPGKWRWVTKEMLPIKLFADSCGDSHQIWPCRINLTCTFYIMKTIVNGEAPGLLLHGLTVITVWVSNYIHHIIWDEFAYSFPNLGGATIEFAELIRNLIPHFTGHVIIYPWLVKGFLGFCLLQWSYNVYNDDSSTHLHLFLGDGVSKQ